MSRLVTVFLLVGAVCRANAAHTAGKLPDGIKRCNAKETATLNECLKTAIIDGLQKLKNGEKSLGLLKLDPLHVDQVELDLGNNQAPFLFKAHNVEVYGLTNSVLKSVNFHPEKFSLEFTSVTPNATFTFDYEATGRILLLPVNGKGPGKFVFTDMSTSQKIHIVPEKKNGQVYAKVVNYELMLDAKKLDIHLEGLLKGNKQISDQLSEFLRREWRLFLDQLRGPSGVAFGDIFKDLANRVFSRVRYGEIFPGADDLIPKS